MANQTANSAESAAKEKALQQAFIELTVEKGYSALTVSAITRRADVDRMTFYSHYDTIDDIFREFVDDMEHEISERISEEGGFNIDRFFEILNSLMYKEIEFFRHAAAASSADLRTAFKDTIGRLIRVDLGSDTDLTESHKTVISDLAAVCIAYSYLDWLTGDYGDISLDEVVGITKGLLKDHLPQVMYNKEI